jgi:hypothetical protein
MISVVIFAVRVATFEEPGGEIIIADDRRIEKGTVVHIFIFHPLSSILLIFLPVFCFCLLHCKMNEVTRLHFGWHTLERNGYPLSHHVITT